MIHSHTSPNSLGLTVVHDAYGSNPPVHSTTVWMGTIRLEQDGRRCRFCDCSVQPYFSVENTPLRLPIRLSQALSSSRSNRACRLARRNPCWITTHILPMPKTTLARHSGCLT